MTEQLRSTGPDVFSETQPWEHFLAQTWRRPVRVTIGKTCRALFDRLNAIWGFDLDMAASPHNAKCARFYDVAIDGLKQPWAPYVCFCNPPYGHGIKLWVRRVMRNCWRARRR